MKKKRIIFFLYFVAFSVMRVNVYAYGEGGRKKQGMYGEKSRVQKSNTATPTLSLSPTASINAEVVTHVSGATLSTYTPQGAPYFIMHAHDIWYHAARTAERSVHYSFSQPDIQLFLSDQVQWHLHANQGESDHLNTQIQLTGGVTLVRLPPASPLSLYTQALILLPRAYRAVSQVPVHIQKKGWQLSAAGMHLNLKTGVVSMKQANAYHTSPPTLPKKKDMP